MAIITLTSDIGTKDYLPGAIKGCLLQANPSANIFDITHDISPYNYNEAVYIIKNSFAHFPKHSWHLLLVNMFDAVDSRLLLAYHQGHYFACADNGLLPMVFDGVPEQVLELPMQKSNNVLEWAGAVAKAIASVENGGAFHLLGIETERLVEKHSLKAIFTNDYIEGRIIYIDRFENVVVNITQKEFEAARQGRSFNIIFKGNERISRLSETYAHVPEGHKLALFNTAGYLEIAVNKGNAAGLFGLQPFTSQANPQFVQSRMFYQTVRVHFD